MNAESTHSPDASISGAEIDMKAEAPKTLTDAQIDAIGRESIAPWIETQVGTGLHRFARAVEAAALAAAQSAMEPDEPMTVRDYGDALLDAGLEFWKAVGRENWRAQGACQWLTDDQGGMVIFTRGEYKSTLMNNIQTLPVSTTLVFSEPGDEDEGVNGMEACVRESPPAAAAPEGQEIAELMAASGEAENLVVLERAVSVMDDVLTDIEDWEDKALAEAVSASRDDLQAWADSIRMVASIEEEGGPHA